MVFLNLSLVRVWFCSVVIWKGKGQKRCWCSLWYSAKCTAHGSFFLNLNIDTEAMSEASFGDSLCFSSFLLLAYSLWYIIATFTIPQVAHYLFFPPNPLALLAIFFSIFFFLPHHTNNCGIHSMKKSISGLRIHEYYTPLQMCDWERT